VHFYWYGQPSHLSLLSIFFFFPSASCLPNQGVGLDGASGWFSVLFCSVPLFCFYLAHIVQSCWCIDKASLQALRFGFKGLQLLFLALMTHVFFFLFLLFFLSLFFFSLSSFSSSLGHMRPFTLFPCSLFSFLSTYPKISPY
jgi:hypothetical protein